MAQSLLLFLLTLLGLTLGTFVTNHPSSPRAAESKPAWQVEWERTLEAAKKEKEVTFVTSRDFDIVFSQYFHKKYPEIKPIATMGGRMSGFLPRIITERRAGKYLWDLYLGSSSSGYVNLQNERS